MKPVLPDVSWTETGICRAWPSIEGVPGDYGACWKMACSSAACPTGTANVSDAAFAPPPAVEVGRGLNAGKKGVHFLILPPRQNTLVGGPAGDESRTWEPPTREQAEAERAAAIAEAMIANAFENPPLPAPVGESQRGAT